MRHNPTNNNKNQGITKFYIEPTFIQIQKPKLVN